MLPLDLLCCPRCRGPLARSAALSCAGCSLEFPEFDGLPWLFADPMGALGEWRGRTHAFLAELEAQAAHYRGALGPDITRAATRNRLKLLAAACGDHARRLRALLAPLGLGTPAAPDLYRALGVSLPSGQGLSSYYANLHRDWCWGQAENEASFRLVDRALGSAAPGRTLLLGVGAGRLAYDLHQQRRPQTLVAADFNPLFLFAAQRLLAGKSIELYEFPIAPRDIDSNAILRKLQAPAPAAEGLHLVFADATDGPFAAGAFDTVVTPWLIDIVDEDLEVFARRINAWLRPGGRWVNSGSLSFSGDDPARRYALEEVLEIVAAAGLAVESQHEDVIPYLGSPASRHARLESVVTFAATKQGECTVPARARRSPDWLNRTDLPVPLLPALEGRQLELRVLAYVASLIDGRRSVRDVAQVLIEQRLMSPSEAEPTVLGFLRRLHAETQARAATRPSL
jgi:uncharacterized protein YbaR (Trm112 family)